jgi:predicted DNA binding CopG/RHH family protein
LAEFWDTHDLTDFQDELEEVAESAFERRTMLKIPLQPEEMEAIKEIVESQGIASADLIRQWVLEKIQGS